MEASPLWVQVLLATPGFGVLVWLMVTRRLVTIEELEAANRREEELKQIVFRGLENQRELIKGVQQQ